MQRSFYNVSLHRRKRPSLSSSEREYWDRKRCSHSVCVSGRVCQQGDVWDYTDLREFYEIELRKGILIPKAFFKFFGRYLGMSATVPHRYPLHELFLLSQISSSEVAIRQYQRSRPQVFPNLIASPSCLFIALGHHQSSYIYNFFTVHYIMLNFLPWLLYIVLHHTVHHI